MQAYKFKGTIDHSGHLVIHEPIIVPPGEVELIVWASEPIAKNEASPLQDVQPEAAPRKRPSKIKALENWFANTEPAPTDFDPEQARWEALKEKYDL
jgi:hypothetical protein